MVSFPEKVRRDHDLSITLPAGPSAGDPTRTGEPLGTPRGADDGAPASSVATRLHDPERYQFLREHGRGGLGKVSRAHDRALGRDVAIKELIRRGPVSEVRFLREALITARLEHPAIVPVHEAGCWPDGTPFYAMKLVAGRPLSALIAERSTVEERIGLLHHVIAVADAIAYAHGRNIIHRDLKPANVIVGEFGETVVIDWGLAKELSADDELAAGSADSAPRDDGLTGQGSVLGTPVYMAPEQERGERVDQRADVFAIGAMLWELCSLQRVPRSDPQRRHRVLRRAGIDRDLAAIIDKALAPDPALRYPDAGALAADLKAFKAGARIAARSYSLLAMLAHWTRRHRALTLSVVAAIALAAAGSAVFVHNLAVEGDRADRAQHRLAVKNAELLLAGDPTAASAALASDRGPDPALADLLQAKAEGLGVAKVRAQVHRGSIYLLQPLPDGTLLSIAEDGVVAITAIDGRSRVVASNAAVYGATAWSRARGLVAYACQPGGICLLEPSGGVTRALATPGFGVPDSLDLAPDGQRLIALYGPRIVMWDLTGATATSLWRVDLPGASQVVYASAAHAIAVAADRVELVDVAAGRAGPSIELATTALATDGERVVLGNARGEILELRLDRWPEHDPPRALCAVRVNALALLHTRPGVAYACQDGDYGVAELGGEARRLAHDHERNAMITVSVSADDRYAVFGGQHGAVRIHDAVTGLVTPYQGQIACLPTLAAPAPSFPYIAAGDDDGAIRIWGPPQAITRTVLQADFFLFDTTILDDGTVIGVGGDPVVRWWRNGATGAVATHAQGSAGLRRSPDGMHFATFGYDGDLVLWDGVAPVRRMHAGMLTSVTFLADGVSLVSAGEDGRLLAWTAGRAPQLLAQFSQPVVSVDALPGDDVIVAERGGDLWKVSARAPEGRLRVRSGQGESMVKLITSEDGRWVGAGTSTGEVVVLSTATWQPIPVIAADGPIRALAFSADASLIAAVSKTGTAFLAAHPAAPRPVPEHWKGITVPARDAKFSRDGQLLAITTNDGGVLFYSLVRRRWRYVPLSAADVFRGQFSRDSAHYASVDASGHATLFDVRKIVY